MRDRLVATLLVLLACWTPLAGAQPQSAWRSRAPRNLQTFGVDNAPAAQQAFEPAYDEADRARDAQADTNFDSIMIPQNEPAPAAAAEQGRSSGYGGILGNRMPARPPVSTTGAAQAGSAEVEVPLPVFAKLRERLLALEERQALRQGPVVVLGSSSYTGQAIPGALRLTMQLQVTLGRPDQWKTVPLVGDDVVLVRAVVDGRDIPVSRQAGFHVWVTRRTGEATVTADLLVPARGPRGSIEYDFMAARTPVTSFSCYFPVAGLEPRLDKAVQSEATPENEGTRVTATLRPTTRIHLVGFRDLGETEGRQAKVYAESLNLLSLEEGALDLFTVIRYTILYAGTKEFVIQVPPGLAVVSADGEGAFRYTLEEVDGGTLIRGETAFPIRNDYEISIRLHREAPRKGETFFAPLPRCHGVEREHGWLGIEVPGKLLLEEGEQVDKVLPVDVRQLPEEMIRSAVSPILRAYRYHDRGARVQLVTSRLPEEEPESGSIDRIRAFSTVNQEGNVMTDMRITLRNRLRHSLVLEIPEAMEVLSTHLDGQKVKPSESQKGRILLPLKRSAGDDRLEAFTLSVVLRGRIDPLGLWGTDGLRLPAVDLPVSSLAWSVHLPARNHYSTLEGDIEPQVYSGRGSWHRPSYRGDPASWAPAAGDHEATVPDTGTMEPVGSAHSGAMPVRIKLPEKGIRLEYARYWLNKNHPLEVAFSYVRSWLTIPAWLLLAAVLALGLVLLANLLQPARRGALAWLGAALVLVSVWPLAWLAGWTGILLGVLGALFVMAARNAWPGRAAGAIAEWWRTLPRRYKERDKPAGRASTARVAGMVVLSVFMGVVVLLLLDAVLAFLYLPVTPL